MTISWLIMRDRIVRLHRGTRGLASDLMDGAETTARLNEKELPGLIGA